MLLLLYYHNIYNFLMRAHLPQAVPLIVRSVYLCIIDPLVIYPLG